MNRLAAFLLAVLSLFGLASAPLAQTSEYATLATISATLGVNGNRLCLGEASRNDIGCPGYAPYVTSGGLVGIGTINPRAALEVSGSGGIFTGRLDDEDKLGFDNIRIGLGPVSGSLPAPRIIFDETRDTAPWQIDNYEGRLRFFRPGIIYMSLVSSTGFLGVGTHNPEERLDVHGNAVIRGISTIVGNSNYLLPISSSYDLALQTHLTNRNLLFAGDGGGYSIQSTEWSTGNPLSLALNPNGGPVGIGTANPGAMLTVSNGEVQPSSSGRPCTGSLAGAIRYTSGDLSYCDGMTWIEIAGAVSSTPGGVSGSIQFNSGGTFLGRNDIVIDGTGRVGIGINAPSARLHVEGDTMLNGNSIQNAGTMEFRYFGDTSNSWVGIANVDNKKYMHIGGHGGAGYRRIGLWGDEVFVPGRIGVGTTTPTVPLEVSGRISATVMQLGESNDTCTTDTVGTIRRNPVTGRFQICRL
jgi:hypothetical protein